MSGSSPMVGSDGTYSYAKNSTLQRDGLNSAKDVMKEALIEALEVKTLSGGSTTFAIADLGCSVGPNTFLAMQTIVETVSKTYHSQGLDPENLEFQVFFNDQTCNDFNTLFASLPDPKGYFVAGVPGSFYDRLFPSSSIHVAYSSSSLHWLSRVPKELEEENSLAWNKGRIQYTGASEADVKAFANQYEKDIGNFLRARAQEIVSGGLIIILMPGFPDGGVTHDVGIALTFLGSILMDMVKEGLLNQHQVDSFSIPHVYPCVKEMTRLVEENGCFKIVKMELRNSRPNKEAPIEMESAIMHLRAFTETIVVNHLGHDIAEELFSRSFQQITKLSHMLDSSGIEIGAQLFAVLQRK